MYSSRMEEGRNIRIADSVALTVFAPQGSRSCVAIVALRGYRNS